MNRIIVLLVYSFAFTTCVYSQTESFLIKGEIKEQGTNNLIPYANIWITNTTQGTAAGASGEFIIRVDRKYQKEFFKISCIGYHTKLVSIDSIRSIPQVIITLESDVSLLDEVVIKTAPLNPADIVKKAIEAVSENYLNSPFNMEYYSEIVATDNSSHKEFKLETILFGYSEGYTGSKRKFFEITQRRTSGEDPLKIINYEYWPSYEIQAVDQISSSYKQGVLNLKNIDKFNLKYSGVSMFDEDTVYNIEYYAPKPPKEITGYGIVPKMYKGNIYITSSTYAVVKHEITNDHFSYSVIYKKLEGKYFPYFISGERKTKATVVLSKITNSIILRSIETKNAKIIDYKTNEHQNANLVKFDEVFWNTNYPIEVK